MNEEKVYRKIDDNESARVCSKEWMKRNSVERLMKIKDWECKFVLNFAVFNFSKEFDKVGAT